MPTTGHLAAFTSGINRQQKGIIMKKLLKLTALFLAVITVSACQKENTNRLIIEAECMNGSKLAINGNNHLALSQHSPTKTTLKYPKERLK